MPFLQRAEKVSRTVLELTMLLRERKWQVHHEEYNQVLAHLDEFEPPGRVVDEAHLFRDLCDGVHELGVAASLVAHRREQVLDQRQEQRLVLVCMDMCDQTDLLKTLLNTSALEVNQRRAPAHTLKCNSPTSLDRFMSLRTLITMMDSGSLVFARLAAPSVRRTERMLRSPKS